MRRKYPLYQLGGPQLRVFRTNFFIQLVRPGVAQPEDTVQFRIPMEMTRVDLRNYLESIYNVPVAAVRTRVQYGSNKRRDHRNVRIKKPDYKVAYVQLPSQTPSKEQNGQGSTPCFRRTAARGGRPGGPGTPDSPGALGVATAPGGLDPEDWPAGSLRMEVFYSSGADALRPRPGPPGPRALRHFLGSVCWMEVGLYFLSPAGQTWPLEVRICWGLSWVKEENQP
ncbi:39S ribosomal protein L23, mitochondrial isoform X2 [Papio anubis]|uniref:39S ribosomal protein L23, mitochondrial isoform X2 n=1 Tax=Papio anubis TaxID=9555 RepID=UPI0012AE3117|nr:39S ribosomal protein L23, mitochondrial isoform X2 [Papio anubis]